MPGLKALEKFFKSLPEPNKKGYGSMGIHISPAIDPARYPGQKSIAIHLTDSECKPIHLLYGYGDDIDSACDDLLNRLRKGLEE